MQASLRRICPVVALATISGCVSKNPTIPDTQSVLPPDSAFSLAQPEGNQSRVPSFQSFFPEEELHPLLYTAVTQNADWKVHLAKIDLARAEAGYSTAGALPSAQTSLDWRRGQEKNRETSFLEEDLPEWKASGLVSWEFDLWGKWKAIRKSAVEKIHASKNMARAAEIALVHEVADAWYVLRFHQEDLRILEKSLDSQDSILRLYRQRFDAGLENNVTIARQETRRTELVLEQNRLSKNLRLSALHIQRLVGKPLTKTEQPTEILSQASIPEPPPTLPSKALGQRPDLRAAQARLRAELHLEKGARLNLFPSIGFKLTGLSMTNSLSDPSERWETAIGPFLDIPLWSPDRIRKTRVAKAKVELMEAEWKALIVRAVEEVEGAALSFAMTKKELDLAEKVVNQADRVLAVTKEKLATGLVSQLELLDDEKRLFEAERKALTVRLETFQAALALSKSLGCALEKAR
jgi:NodT family efflux transporter outer membrane factor (OMF) lipoprotein|tara:strand:- start:45 stop:1439 length:1395 start_codon:yes stop_codon:yes gene_type:complete